MSVDAFLESMPQESMGCSTPNTDSEESSFQLGQIFQYSCLEMIRVSRSEYPAKRSNFTIDHILGKQDTTSNEENYTASPNIRYDWLTYTRYKPPKLQSKWLNFYTEYIRIIGIFFQDTYVPILFQGRPT